MFVTDPLPTALKDHSQKQLQSIQEACERIERGGGTLWLHLCTLDKRLFTEIVEVVCASDYVAGQLQRKPELLVELAQSQDLWQSYGVNTYCEKLAQAVVAIESEEALSVALRRFRQREMVRIIWRDVNGLAAFQETAHDLSRLADACIDVALGKLYEWVKPQWGTPFYPGTEQAMPMVVLGMGKLGANELNLSSDIDLMVGNVTYSQFCIYISFRIC